MREPLSFVYGNCVFGGRLDDAWAAFAVATSSYEWLSAASKRSRMRRLVSALAELQADVQILRVAHAWDRAGYVRELQRSARGPHADAARRYAAEHACCTLRVGCARAALFVLVSLREPQRDVASWLSSAGELRTRERLGALGRLLSAGERRMLGGARLERLQRRAEQIHARLQDFLPVRPALGRELQWLVRRAYCRGLGEPRLDRWHTPAALVLERHGEAQVAPLHGQLARWTDGRVEQHARCLLVESELGVSWQAQLVLGALPERAGFPGARAELMFAPPESLDFPIDLSLNARFLHNGLALRMAQRRVQDADQIAGAESGGDQGVSDAALQRTVQARELLAYLRSTGRPPLLRVTVAVAIGAAGEQQLAERVEACRRAYGEVQLHRPLGDQLRLFLQHLPGQRTLVRGYDDVLTLEQVAAMMPTATHAAGSRGGFYLGHTLSGSRQPVRFDLREGSDRDRNTAILSVGALGSGKTTLAQKLQYEGFLQGARVIDCDPKGDHGFHLLDEVAPHAETIALRPEARLRGMLDPLRVAPEHLRREAAVSFLCDLLPAGAEPAWETAVLAAVDRVMRRCTIPTCLEVVRALRAGEGAAHQVGSALEVYAGSGITQLGFADADRPLPRAGERQVTYIPIRDLPGPEPGMPRADYSQSERVGGQIVRLIAMFAMQLLSLERERLKLFGFDEGWRLLGDPVGRSLLASLQRMGRSELAVPIVSTQLVSDALVGERESFENLLGATFVFGMRSHAEATRALALLGLEPGDRRAQELLLALDAGRCLMRDHRGRVEAIQVELASRPLLRALSAASSPASRLGAACA